MVLFLKLCVIWLLIGFVCTAITVLHDIVIYKIEIRERELKGMLLMIALGFISVPVVIYFIIDEIREEKEFKNAKK